MNPTDIAPWLAGLFEGEGTITFDKKSNGVRLHVSMTDHDVVQRIQDVTGLGSVIYRPFANKKDQWIWTSCNKDDVLHILTMIHPYMGTRRSDRIQAAFERLKNNRGFNQPIQHGTRNGYRVERNRGLEPCATCITANQIYFSEKNRAYYLRKKENGLLPE